MMMSRQHSSAEFSIYFELQCCFICNINCVIECLSFQMLMSCIQAGPG